MLEQFHERGIDLTEDEYRTGLRTLFPEDYQEFSDEQLEDIIYERISQMSPSEAEGFFSSLGNFFRDKVAPIAIAALPAVATIAGTAIGGPVGTAVGGAVGRFASDAISRATNVRPNQTVANIGNAATAISSGNFRAAIPAVLNVTRDVGNAISPGAGNTVANVASTVAQVASGLGGQQAGGGTQTPANTGSSQNPVPASSQLLSFLRSTPFLQNMLSSITTGNPGTGVQMLREDGSSTTTSYMEMLESLKYLTESAIAEADNMGISMRLPLESEADRDSYLEALIEDVTNYENTLLPNYDTIVYN